MRLNTIDYLFANDEKKNLLSVIESCRLYNETHDCQFKNDDYVKSAGIHRVKCEKIDKILEHIKSEEFSIAIVRVMAAHFFLDKNSDTQNNLIEAPTVATVEEIE